MMNGVLWTVEAIKVNSKYFFDYDIKRQSKKQNRGTERQT